MDSYVCDCDYSGEPVYSWDSVVIFENGAVVLEDYWVDYCMSRGIIRRMEGWELNV